MMAPDAIKITAPDGFVFIHAWNGVESVKRWQALEHKVELLYTHPAPDAQAIIAATLKYAAELAVEWGNCRIPDGGGNALRNYADAIRALDAQEILDGLSK